VVDSVESSSVGQERLSCANVGVGLLPADVLLASLKSKTVSLVACGIPALANHSSGNSALVLVSATQLEVRKQGNICCCPARLLQVAEGLNISDKEILLEFCVSTCR
jgi:hypothetical protein